MRLKKKRFDGWDKLINGVFIGMCYKNLREGNNTEKPIDEGKKLHNTTK